MPRNESESSAQPVSSGGGAEELHFAFVRQLGTRLDRVIEHLSATLDIYGFSTTKIKLSSFIAELDPPCKGLAPGSYDRYRKFMDTGDSLRQEFGGHVLATFAINKVSTERRLQEFANKTAYVYDSLMHEDEVAALRQAYGSRLFVISVQSDEASRKNAVYQMLRSAASGGQDDFDAKAEELIVRDMGRGEGGKSRKLSFERTFFLADLFLDGSATDLTLLPDDKEDGENEGYKDESTNDVLRRFLRQLFSFPHGTPNVEETAMAGAFLSSLRSSALSRRVGAAVTSPGGDVIAVGRNDVPKSGGGLYDGHGSDHKNDSRFEFKKETFRVLQTDRRGADSNDLVKLEMLEDLFQRAADAGIVEFGDEPILTKLLGDKRVRESQFFEVITYGRTVHAEMDAITTAARSSHSVRDGTLYVTTFPCHECIRHIIASGLRKVVFLEPYHKSRAGQLHADAVWLSAEGYNSSGRVEVRAFSGISPRRLNELFSFEERKNDDPESLDGYGLATQWRPGESLMLRGAIRGDKLTQDMQKAAFQVAEKLASRAATIILEALKQDQRD